MADVLYTNRLKDMSNYLDDEWLNHATTPYTPFSNPFENTTAITLPHHSHFTSPGPGYLDTSSPSVGVRQNVENEVYASATEATTVHGAGLGIATSTTFVRPLSAVSTFPAPRDIISGRSGYHDSNAVGRVRSFTQSAFSPAPQAANATLNPQPHPFHPIPIAPHPPILQQPRQPNNKRQFPEINNSENERSPRRRSTSTTLSQAQGQVQVNVSKPPTDLSEEEQMLFKLKQEENLPWKDIAKTFEAHFGRKNHVPALQMRYKRLKERLRTWTDEDVEALELAHEYWQKAKFEIISQKMLEHGAQEKWPAKLCQQKWERLHPEQGVRSSASAIFPQHMPLASSNSTTSSDGWVPQETTDTGYGESPISTFVTRSPGPLTTPVATRSPLSKSPREEYQP